ncbi:hypothetical protein ACXN5S_17300 [Pseudoroseicyclus sp. H15]
MTSLLTNQIATMTEMRDPQKVLDRAHGKPVAVLRNSKLVGYFVPVEATTEPEGHRAARMDEVVESMARRRSTNQPVLDYLRDK